MSGLDEISSKSVLLSGNLPLETVSGWLIWEITIIAGFFFLSAMTGYFLLARSIRLNKTRIKPLIPGKRKKVRSLRTQKNQAKTRKKKHAVRGISKKKTGSRKKRPVLTQEKKRYRVKTRKRSSLSRPLKRPFIHDPSVRKSYTKKYQTGENRYRTREKTKAVWEKVELIGFDSDCNRLDLVAYLLAEQFTWRNGSAELMENNKRFVSPDKLFGSKGIKQAFENATGVISVGVVTEMMDNEGREGLALARAENMVAWLKNSLPQIPVTDLLNLEHPVEEWGEDGATDSQPEKQRPVLWLCLQTSPDEVDVEEALKNALCRSMQLPFDFQSFQKVSLIKMRTP